MSSYMTSMARYSTNCPFLHRTSTATLRSLASTPNPLAPQVSNLASRAVGSCPVMGPEVAKKMRGISVRGMASVAGPKEVREMHKVGLRW
jgi:5-aminolevulinate synthase